MSIMLEYEGRMWLPAVPIISNNDYKSSIINDINDNSFISMSYNDNSGDNVIDNDKLDMKFYNDMKLNQYQQPQIVRSGKVFLDIYNI